MEKVYVLLDVGGTQMKGGIADSRGTLMKEIIRIPALAKEEKDIIFDNLLTCIHSLLRTEKDKEIAGIGMAFPGPFDYEKGISLMKGLDKYESIYGISIPDELKKRDRTLENIKFSFLHDVEAFAIGVSRFGSGKDKNKILCLCIGTGTGSAFIAGKKAVKKAMHGVPENGWLYNTPYKETIIDDYLSVRGLMNISRQVLGQSLNGEELYVRCKNHDKKAMQVYQRFGEHLLWSMVSFLEGFKPDAVVLGGQISKSFPFFGKDFEQECAKRNIAVYLEPETSKRAMQGLFITMEQEEKRC